MRNDLCLRVAIVWNGTVFQEKTYTPKAKKSTITVGGDDKNEFNVVAPGLSSVFPMFERVGDSFVARFTNKIDGSISLDGEEWDLDELIEEKTAARFETVSTVDGSADAYQVALKEDDWGMFRLGTINVFFQVMVQKDVIPPITFRSMFEAALVACILVSAALHAVLLIWTFLSYDPDADLTAQTIPDRFVEFMVDDVKDPLEEEELDVPEEDTTGKKAGGEEGKFGDEDSEIPESKVPKVDADMADEIDVKNIGVNKALGSTMLGAGPLKNIFGNQEGFDSKMAVAMSGEGGDLVVGRGAGGMGMRGTGKGGGGEGFGRIHGLGKVDTGGGKGTGGAVGKKKERKVTPKLSQGAPQVGDFCDQGNIRRVVSSKANAIKYCFEKELQQNPQLSGKITAQWRVGLDGTVSGTSIANSTMSNRNVEGCITRVIDRMRFDKPDGGICVIQYPFVFSGIE